ncbi:MAG: hypothetical protein AAGG02_08760 [Cyanobacteria bacterium P01_H01_bin.15]
MNPKTGQSKEPADFILTHLKNIQQALDINVYSFEEFFDLFSEHWITMRIKRCWFGQASDNEHGRARALMSRPDNTPWVFDSISGGPKGNRWRDEVAPGERRTCYNLNVEIKSPFKWEQLRQYKINLIESGVCGISSRPLAGIGKLNDFNGF